MRKTFTYLSRVMAVLFTAVLAMPMWAQLPEENHNVALGTHGIGEIVTIPALEGVIFHNTTDAAPLSESAYTQGEWYAYVKVKATDRGWTGYYWQYELAGIWCMNNGADEIHLTRYEFDEWGSPIKQHNYTITITVAGGMVEVGTWEPWCSTETPDATVLKDTTIHYGDSYYDQGTWKYAPIDNYVGLRYVSSCYENNGELVKSWYCVSTDDITVTSSDPTVVSVEWNEMGSYHEIKGLKRGQSTITVSAPAVIDSWNSEPKHVAKSVSYNVTVTGDAGPNIGFYQDYEPLTGMTLDGSYDTPYYWPVVRDEMYDLFSGTLNVTSSNPAVATIDNPTSNEVHFTFVGYGTTIITATVPGNDYTDESTASFTLTYEDPNATDMYFTDYEGNRIDTMNVGTDEWGNPVYPYYNSGNYYTGARLVIKQHSTGDYMSWAYVTIAPEDPTKVQINTTGQDGDGKYMQFESLALGETDIVATFEGDGWNGDYWNYSPATARLHINYVNTYRREATLHFMDGYEAITSYSYTDGDCAHRGISYTMPQFNTWLKDETTGYMVYYGDPLPLTVTSSDESVVEVSYNEDDHFIACDPKGYGTATITVTFAGDDTYAESTGTISYSFYKNTTPMHECILVDKNGDPIPSIVATEGDLIDAPDIVRADGEDMCYTYLAMATTTDRSRWRLKPECSCWDYFYPKVAGLDTIVFTYRRESFFDDNEHDYWAYGDQAVELRIPVTIMPYFTPVAADAQTDLNLNPTGNENVSFSTTANDTYNSSEGQLEIQSVVTAANLKLALDSMATGLKDWNDLLPGATTFNLQPGTGKIRIQCSTVEGYELKVLVRDHGTATITQPSMGFAEVDYDVDQVTAVLIYLWPTGGSSPAPKRAPAATKDAPKAIIKSITVSPQFDIVAKQDPEHPGVYYSTFFDSAKKYQLPNDGTEAYVATISGGDLHLSKIAGNADVLPANTAVILKAPSDAFALTASDAAPVAVSAENQLQGVDEPTAAPANCYVLSGHSSDNLTTGVGFYQFSGTLAAHKAYIINSGSTLAPSHRMRFVFDSPTGLENSQKQSSLSQKVLENGQLIIIKNGVRYNAQGQIVK